MAFTHFPRMFLVVKKDKALDVLDVRLLGAKTEVTQACGRSHLVQKLRRRHRGNS